MRNEQRLEDNQVLLEIIGEQKRVIESLEFKIGGFANEASKIESERRELNSAVSGMRKAYTLCQQELRETTSALKSSQDAESGSKAEIQVTLKQLLHKLREKESFINALQNENKQMLRKYEKEKLCSEQLDSVANERVESLRRECDSKDIAA